MAKKFTLEDVQKEIEAVLNPPKQTGVKRLSDIIKQRTIKRR